MAVIRSKGVPLYPQFPLFNYFVDFANPFLRIGLELDGADWHDTEKDKQRDELLALFGWKIFRVRGSETVVEFELPMELEERGATDDEQEDALWTWLMTTCDGVVEAIDNVYFKNSFDQYGGLCVRTLDNHRLAQFELLPDPRDTETI